MERRTMIGWAAVATPVLLIGGFLLSPQYQLWRWMQRYPSVAAARERLRTNSNDAKAHLTLAWTMLSSETSGKEVSVQEARHEWEEVIRCDPANELAITMYAPMMIRNGDLATKDRAKQLLLPIAVHGNARVRPDAQKILQDLGAPLPNAL